MFNKKIDGKFIVLGIIAIILLPLISSLIGFFFMLVILILFVLGIFYLIRPTNSIVEKENKKNKSELGTAIKVIFVVFFIVMFSLVFIILLNDPGWNG